MPYQRTIYRFTNAIEIEDHQSAKYGAPGMPREAKVKATPEQIEKRNQLNREKTCRHKLRTHFDVNDYFVTVTYAADNRPQNMDEAKLHWRKFIQQLRREYKKRGETLKWIRNIEVGTRGAWHIHIVLNRIPNLDMILGKAWTHGAVHMQLLHQKAEFAELAAYMVKTPKTDSKLREADYSASRNLPVKEPEKTVHHSWQITDKIRVPAGWYLDKNSLHEGVNPITGHPYRCYTLLRNVRKSKTGYPQERIRNPKKRKKGK